MTLEASGTIDYAEKIHYIHTLLRGEALQKLEMLSAEVGITATEKLSLIILVLGEYFSPVNALPKKKRAMRRGMRNPGGL